MASDWNDPSKFGKQDDSGLFGIGTPPKKNDWNDPSKFGVKEETNNNPASNLLTGLARGVTHGLPKQLAQASQYLGIGGREQGDIAQQLVERGNRAEAEAGTPGAFEQAGEMIPSSVGIPAALYGAGLAASVIPGAQPAAPFLLGAGKVASFVTPAIFGLSQAEQTRSEAIKRGVDPGSAPLKTGLIEAAGETIGNIALLKMFGPLGGVAKSIVGQTGAKKALSGTVLGALKQLALVTAPTEILTEMGQNYGEALVEKHAGIRPEASPWNEAVSAIGPTAIMTALLGGGGHALHQYAAAKAADVLASPIEGYNPNNLTQDMRSLVERRKAYAENVAEIIPKENEPLRQQWRAYAQNKIENNLPIDITSSLDSLSLQIDTLMDTMPDERAAIEEITIPATVTGGVAQRIPVPGERTIPDESVVGQNVAPAVNVADTEKLLNALRGPQGEVIAPAATENVIENVAPAVTNVATEVPAITTENAIAPENVPVNVTENVAQNVPTPEIEHAAAVDRLNKILSTPAPIPGRDVTEELAAAVPQAPAAPAAVAAPVAAGSEGVTPAAAQVKEITTTGAVLNQKTNKMSNERPIKLSINENGTVKVGDSVALLARDKNGDITATWETQGVVPRNTKRGSTVAATKQIHKAFLTETPELTALVGPAVAPKKPEWEVSYLEKQEAYPGAGKQIARFFVNADSEKEARAMAKSQVYAAGTKAFGVKKVEVPPAAVPAKPKNAAQAKAKIAAKKAAASTAPAAAPKAAVTTTPKGMAAAAPITKEKVVAKKQSPTVQNLTNQIAQIEKSMDERAKIIEALDKQGKSTVGPRKTQEAQKTALNKLKRDLATVNAAEAKARVGQKTERLANQDEIDELEDSKTLLSKQLKDATRDYDESVRLERPERQRNILKSTRDDIKKELTEVNKELEKARKAPSFVRAEEAQGGGQISRTQAVVDKVLSYLKNPPKVRVLDSINSFINSEDEVGKALKEYMVEHQMLDEKGEDNLTLGFYWQGQIYIIASNNKSSQQVVNTLTHELTHLGLGNFISKQKGVPGIGSTKIKYDILMDKVYEANSEQVNLITRTTHQHLNVETAEGRRKAAEEWLCNQAYEAQPKWYDKLIAIFHEVLRKVGIDTKLSDSEVRVVLQNAFREFGERVDSPLFSRSNGFEKRNYGARILAGEERVPSNVAPLLSDVATHFEAISRKDGRIDHRSATKRQKEHIVESIKEMLRASIKRYPESLGWYRKDLETTMDILQDIYPELKNQSNRFRMKLAIALSSNGNDTTTNIEIARKIYESFKSKKVMKSEVKAERAAAIVNSLVLADRLGKTFKTDIAYEKWLLGKSYVGDLYNDVAERLYVDYDAAKKIIGGSENVDTMLPRAIVFGPKVGAFFTNLSGDFSQITMDRWFTRTMGRLMGHLVEGGSRQEVEIQRENLKTAMDNSPEGLRLCQIQGDLFPGPKNLDETAKKIAKLCGKEDFRDRLNSVPGGADLRIAANNRNKFLNGALPIDSPSSGSQRQWFRDRVNEAREDLAKEGINYENADIQAAIWIGEKELYKLFGVKGKRGDYY
jgi:hypothetical protein